MNKLTKIGVSALCGSLASVAANAGSMEVLGGATATWSSNEGTVNGNPIGMNSGLTFKGTGELDNGTTFTLTITGADQAGFSASQIALTTPSMGTFTIDNSGGGIDRFDDMMPTAWEEVDGTSLGMGMVTVTGVKGHGHVEWSLPADMLPEGMAAHIAYSPRVAGGKVNDKAVGGDSGKMGSGYDIAVSHNALMDGLNVFAGYSAIEQANDNTDGDKTSKVIGATYAMGGFTVGYQQSEADGPTTTQDDDSTSFGISYAVTDDFSISYGEHSLDLGSSTSCLLYTSDAADE